MSLSGGDAIYGVRLQDDVTSTAKAMSNSVKDLRENLRVLVANSQATRAAMRPLNVGIGEARKMFADAGGNVKLFSAALKDAGVSALDARLLIGKMTTELTASRREALGMDSVWGRMFSPKSIWVASHALSVLQKGWQGVGTAISMAQSAGNTIKENLLDPVIDSAQYRESTLISLRESLLSSGEMKDKGSADKRAKEMFAGAQKMAQETPLDTKEIIDTFTSLGSVGFKSDEAELLARAVADQSTIFGAEKGRQAIEAFGRIKANDKLQMGDFESLTAAKFSKADIVKQLATKFGIKGKDDADTSKQVEKLISSGGVNAYTALNAVIASKEKNGAIGDVAKANADSLKGAISNVKSAFSDLLQSTDIVNWPGVVAFKSFLKEVTGALSSESESGKALLESVQSVTDSILGGLGNIKATDMASWIKRIGAVAIEAAAGIKKIWEWVEKLIHTEGGIGEGLKEVLADVGATIGAGILKGMATGAVKGVTGGLVEGVAGVGNLFNKDRFFGKYFGTIGRDEIDYTKNELNSMLGLGGKEETVEKMVENGKNLVQGLDKGVTEEGEIHSPSRLFEEHGRNLVKGLERGVNNQGRTTNIGSRNIEINVEINVMGSTDDPDALANAIRPMLVDVFTSEFERLAAEGG